MEITPRLLKLILNWYPPYLGAGIRVEKISENWDEIRVSMPLRFYNRNPVGTHFGGNLYSMIDPHIMLLLMKPLRQDYLVWDKSAEIEFVKASKKRVRAIIQVTAEDIEEIKQKTENGRKYLPEFWIDIKDEDDVLVARVKKVLYVRRKPQRNRRASVA